MNTGQTGHGQQVGEAALGVPGFQRNAVEKKLIVGNPEQESTIAGLGQRLLEFVPRGFELSYRALMVDSVQTCVLDENVETVDKGARSRIAVGIGLGSGGNNRPSEFGGFGVSVCGNVTLCTITEVMGLKASPLTAEYAECAEKSARTWL
jgi:hypothetical protein